MDEISEKPFIDIKIKKPTEGQKDNPVLAANMNFCGDVIWKLEITFRWFIH